MHDRSCEVMGTTKNTLAVTDNPKPIAIPSAMHIAMIAEDLDEYMLCVCVIKWLFVRVMQTI